MRTSLRRLAAVKPARYLTPGVPTGLTGLYTHPAPRSTIIFLYTSILEKLSFFPTNSVYRQSTEAVAKSRLAAAESIIPDGFMEWMEKTNQIMKEHPEVFTTPEGGIPHEEDKYVKKAVGQRHFVEVKPEKELDLDNDEWDGEVDGGPVLEGNRTTGERRGQAAHLGRERPGSDEKTVRLDPQPQLTAEQIEELERRIGAGLIEEVIQVAEGELKLVDVMYKAKVWEDLEEKPAPGQWTYFPRDTHTPA